MQDELSVIEDEIIDLARTLRTSAPWMTPEMLESWGLQSSAEMHKFLALADSIVAKRLEKSRGASA